MSLRPVDIRDLVLLGVSCAASAVVGVLVPFVGIPIAVLALALITLRFNAWTGAVVAVLATAAAVLVIGEPMQALVILPALLIAGPAATVGLKRRPALQVLAVVVAVLFVTAVTADAVAAALQHMDLVQWRAAEVALLKSAMLSSAKSNPGMTAAQAKSAADLVGTTWMNYWPAVYFMINGLTGLLSVKAVAWAGKRAGAGTSTFPPIQELDLNANWAWPVIGGIALMAAGTFMHQPDGWVYVTGYNVLLASRCVLFFQGVGDFSALYRKAGVGRVTRGLGYAFLAFSEVVVPVVSLLGLVDLFANLRKLPRDGAGAPHSVEGGASSV
jgi:Predicted membrane protein (DUF2232)